MARCTTHAVRTNQRGGNRGDLGRAPDITTGSIWADRPDRPRASLLAAEAVVISIKAVVVGADDPDRRLAKVADIGAIQVGDDRQAGRV